MTARARAAKTSRRADGDVVAGRNPVAEALRSGVPATALYVTEAGDERVAEATGLARAAGVQVRRVSRGELDRRAAGAAHQGVVLVARPYSYADPAALAASAPGEPPLVVALDGVTDPHNLGAVVRSVAAFGGRGVVVPERRSAGVTPAVWKASAGTVATVPVARVVNLGRQLTSYAEQGLFAVGLAGDAPTPLADCTLLDGPLVLVVGAEGKGLSRLVRERCDAVVRIPIASAAESLNASVAAGVALYEIARTRAAGR